MIIEFYDNGNGNIPVYKELQKITETETKDFIIENIKNLEKYGHIHLQGTGDVKKIEKKFYELKILYNTNTYRMFFITKNNKAILLHLIMKKTNKIPLKDKRIVLNRIKNI